MEIERSQQKSSQAISLALGANILLAALKVTFGVVGHSPALLADGVNSTSDVAYSVVVAVFMRLARKPADQDHPFGHRQFESVAALVVGAFVVTTAIAIFWDAVNNVYDLVTGSGSFAGAAVVALWVALFTVAVKLCLTFYTRRIGEQTSNPAVLAMAYDHRNDVLSATAASTGILLGRMGLPWVDPLVGALVALVILRTGIEILRQSTLELMDTVPNEALAHQISVLLKEIPEVVQIEAVHAHRFGPYLVVNLTIGVDGGMTVSQGDRVASQVEKILVEKIEFLQYVHIHYHPADGPRSRPVEIILDFPGEGSVLMK